ncbi:sugar 3,4-ketoisomerase [Effusibacillus consociatus]|uniref:Sugar 3,4-ketoisomerase n=1 Tax=Effusibacillus consociatus TaxID=1117041 RepID=A0ABV9Q771_9BACL
MEIKIYNFKVMGDQRGSLVSLEGNKNLPFEIKRVYYIFHTLGDVRRGCHAHKDLKQVLVCTSGSCKVLLDDGSTKKAVILDSPTKGLFLDKMIWREMYDFSPDCVLMVLASDYYDESDYIRNYSEFLKGASDDVFCSS